MTEKYWLNSYDNVVSHEISSVSEPLHRLISHAAQNFSDSIAIKNDDYRITFKEFDRLTSVIAGNLRIHGLEKQNRIAIFLPNCPETILAFWSTIKSGATGVMTNPLYSENELLHQFNDSGAKFVITSDILLPKVAGILDKTAVEKVFVVKTANDESSILTETTKFLSWQSLLEQNHGYICDSIDPQCGSILSQMYP